MSAIIGHIILNMSNLDKSAEFYNKIMHELGFVTEYKETAEWGGTISYKNKSHNLWLKWKKNNLHKEFVRDVGLDHLAFRVNKKSMVNRLFEIVKELDIKITREPRKYPEYSPSYYAFYFRDPDNIPLEIFYK
jgi:glyoxylase I family protein